MGNACCKEYEEPLLIRKAHRGIKTPTRSTRLAAGLDIYSPNDYVVPARSKLLIPTGLNFQIPENCYGRLAPKSGIAYANSIHVGAGVIDCDYQGEVQILLYNLSTAPFPIRYGDPIAQLIIERIERPPTLVVLQFSRPSVRGSRGWGSGVFELDQL